MKVYTPARSEIGVSDSMNHPPINLFGLVFVFQEEIPRHTDVGTPYIRRVWACGFDRWLVEDDCSGTSILNHPHTTSLWSYLYREGKTWFAIQASSLAAFGWYTLVTPMVLLHGAPDLSSINLFEGWGPQTPLLRKY